MKSKFSDLKVGQSILDMHDGNDVKAHIEEPVLIRWVYGDVKGMSRIIEMNIKNNNLKLCVNGYTYTNKMLVVVSINADNSITAAFSYDDQRGGYCYISLK